MGKTERTADLKVRATRYGLPRTTDHGPLTLIALGNLINKPVLRYAASVFSGVLLFACFPPLDWHQVTCVACLPLLAAVVSEPNLVRAFLLAYLSGAIFLAGSCYWFVIVTERYGGLGPALAVGLLALFVIVLSVVFGVFGLGEAWVAQRSRTMALLLSPFLWVSLELARTYVGSGFPWNLLGYAIQGTGLRQLASVTAVYGLSFLAVSTSALLVSALLVPWRRYPAPDGAGRRWRRWCAPAFWFALLIVTNWISMPPASPPGSNDAYLLQPDVPLGEETLEHWAPWRDPAPLEGLVAMTVSAVCQNAYRDALAAEGGRSPCSPERSRSRNPRLVIWAENPAPFRFNRDPIFQSVIEGMARRTEAYVIVNTVIYSGQGDSLPRNSAIVLDPDGRAVFEYDKIHLVPFGEYVPAWAFPERVGKITSEVGDYVPGSNYRAAQTPEGAIVVFICYEDIFPQLVRRLTPRGPGVLVNISNDAWYGDSPAAYQHLEMACFRAIENHRFLLRATNDGITAVIDPYGRIVQQIPRHQRMVLPGSFSYLGERTFYTAHGDVFAWLCVAVTVGLIVLRETEGSKQNAVGSRHRE